MFSIGQKVVCRNPARHGWIMNGKQANSPANGDVLSIIDMDEKMNLFISVGEINNAQKEVQVVESRNTI